LQRSLRHQPVCKVNDMAIRVMLRNPTTGLLKTGYVGFSWTTFFFGMFPALFRGDFLTFIGAFAVLLILGILTAGIGSGIAMFVWAFLYNRYYTRRLLERGYLLNDSPGINAYATLKLGISQPQPSLA
jgi:hypothetical protein